MGKVRSLTYEDNQDDVRTIRARAATGEMQESLGREYGVGQTAISFIVRRKRWKHVHDEAEG